MLLRYVAVCADVYVCWSKIGGVGGRGGGGEVRVWDLTVWVECRFGLVYWIKVAWSDGLKIFKNLKPFLRLYPSHPT